MAIAFEHTLHAHSGGKIGNPRLNARQEPMWIQGRNVVFCIRIAKKRPCAAVAAIEMAMRIRRHIALGQLCIPGEDGILRVWITKAQIDAPAIQGVGTCAVGRAAIAQLCRQIDETISRQCNGLQYAGLTQQAVARRGFPPAQQCLAVLPIALEHDVEDAGNGIGPVLRRGPIAQHFHTLHGQQRDGIQIHPRAPPANGAIHVQERALVQTFAVDEHQHLIGVERAQREGWCMVGAIGNRWVRGIQTGHQRCQSLGEVALPH